MDLGIKGKHALVTGGCNGIGGQITKDLLKEGCIVTATTRSDSSGESFKTNLSNGLSDRFNYVIGEFSDQENLDIFLKQNSFEYDILVNNAGHTLGVTDPYCSIDLWHHVFYLNFFSAVQISNACISYMKQQGWGRIVNISSCAGLENSGPVTYTSAKASLTAFSRTMGRILATESPGVVMTALYPGVIVTPGGHWDKVLDENPEHADKYIRERCPLGRFGRIEEFVPAVLFYCSQHASFAHGSIVGIDGGQSKHFLQNNFEP